MADFISTATNNTNDATIKINPGMIPKIVTPSMAKKGPPHVHKVGYHSLLTLGSLKCQLMK